MGQIKLPSGRQKQPGHWARGLTTWFRDSSGASAAEFGLILPVLMLIFFAVIEFGILLNSYIELANGAASGARQASLNRGSTTPYSSTISAIDAGAPNLSKSGITVTISVNGTPCSSDSNAATKTTPANTCQTAYSTAQGAEAVVSTTYPCNLRIMWITFPSCTLSSSSSQIVE